MPDAGQVRNSGIIIYGTVGTVFVFACIGGIIAGIVPALYAIHLKPSEALRCF
jgi:ABC-type lipoprotein release transport system permease subunit